MKQEKQQGQRNSERERKNQKKEKRVNSPFTTFGKQQQILTLSGWLLIQNCSEGSRDIFFCIPKIFPLSFSFLSLSLSWRDYSSLSFSLRKRERKEEKEFLWPMMESYFFGSHHPWGTSFSFFSLLSLYHFISFFLSLSVRIPSFWLPSS